MSALLTLLALSGPAQAAQRPEHAPAAHEVGLMGGVTGVRSSAGEHPVDPTLGLWYRHGFDARFLEAAAVVAVHSEHPAGQELLTTLQRASLVGGWRGGPLRLQLGLGAGLGVTRLTGGVVPVQRYGFGPRAQMDLRLPFGAHVSLMSTAGVTLRGASGDLDLVMGLGVRW